jgi:hypothetical protein
MHSGQSLAGALPAQRRQCAVWIAARCIIALGQAFTVADNRQVHIGSFCSRFANPTTCIKIDSRLPGNDMLNHAKNKK